MNTPNKVPVISKELLDTLEACFTSKLPTSPKVTLDDFRTLQGEQRVLEFLRYHFNEQNKTVIGEQ